jgi:phosphonate transport system substrate-binding protein
MNLKTSLLAFLVLATAPITQVGTAPIAQTDDPVAKPIHLNFGVYQTDKATEMYKRFTPFLEALQEDLSVRLSCPTDIELTIFKSYDDGIEALVAGRVDFVHFGPAPYVLAKAKRPGIEIVAIEHENGEKRFQGVIIVAKDSPIQKIEDLRGKSFAFGDKNSTIGRYLVQANLVDHGIFARDLGSFKYLERHDQVASAVEHRDYDAGSVKSSTFKKANEKGTLRALATFDNVTKPIVAREGIDPGVFGALQQTLYGFKDQAVLKELKISGFMAGADGDFQLVRDGMKKSEEFVKSAAR